MGRWSLVNLHSLKLVHKKLTQSLLAIFSFLIINELQFVNMFWKCSYAMLSFSIVYVKRSLCRDTIYTFRSQYYTRVTKFPVSLLFCFYLVSLKSLKDSSTTDTSLKKCLFLMDQRLRWGSCKKIKCSYAHCRRTLTKAGYFLSTFLKAS